MEQPLSGKKISVIGVGSMGGALVAGLLRDGLTLPENIFVADPLLDRGTVVAEDYGVNCTQSNLECIENADIIFLSVKPQVMSDVLDELAGKVPSRALVISIAAGFPLERIIDEIKHDHVIRAMPNTPGKIGQGITAWVATDGVNEFQQAQAQAILGGLGKTVAFDDEEWLDMVTALSGTGPAYVLLFMEALVDAGVRMGFSRAIAEKLVFQTVRGTVEYAESSGTHLAQLRNEVTSPGGTSAEALNILERGHVRFDISEAVQAAYRRSIELGKSQ